MVRPGIVLSALLLLCSASSAATTSGRRTTSSRSKTMTTRATTARTTTDGVPNIISSTPSASVPNEPATSSFPSPDPHPNTKGGESGPTTLSTTKKKPTKPPQSASNPPSATEHGKHTPSPSSPHTAATTTGKQTTQEANPPTKTSTTTTGKRYTSSKSKTTTTSSSTETEYDVATQMTVGKPPTLCTANTYKYETKMSIPTGWVLIEAGGTGWGEEGSVWDVSSGPGSKLTNMTAECQGGSCASFSANQENDGKMRQRKDGSWYMNVTAGMQPSLKVSGLLLEKDTPVPPKISKRDKESQKFSLTVSGIPPCGLPIAGNCTNRNYEATKKQWDAYQVDDFMDWYVKDNDITDFSTLRKKSWDDFMEPSEVDRWICAIDNPKYQCPPPERDQCSELPNLNQTRGWLMATGATQFTTFLAILYDEVNSLRGTVNTDIGQIVRTNWVQAAKQTWAKIVSTTAAVMGVIVAAFVILQTILGPTVAAAGFAVAGAIAAQTAMSIAGNVGNMLDPGSSDSEFEKSNEWEKEADDLLLQVRQGILNLHTEKTSHENITQVIGGGRWVGNEVKEAFNTNGWAQDSLQWFEKVIVTQFIKKALDEEEAYIVFIPYDKDVQYNEKAWDKGAFDKEMCENHFTGNKNWGYYASCDMTYGPDGYPGMAVVTRPSAKGSKSKSWMEEPLSFNQQEIKGTDIMRSAITGQAKHGYNYTFLDGDFINHLSEDISVASELFSKTSIDQPGLYPVPVCEVTDLVHVPGIQQIMGDIYDSPGHDGYYHTDNPCPCKTYTYEAIKGETKKFTDFVPKGVRESFDSCDVKGDMRAPDDVDLDTVPVTPM